jgi:hypothetical protein
MCSAINYKKKTAPTKKREKNGKNKKWKQVSAVYHHVFECECMWFRNREISRRGNGVPCVVEMEFTC